MSRKIDKQQEERIRRVARMLEKYPKEELTARVMEQFGVTEAAALTYLKRARNLPKPNIADLDQVPPSGPLTDEHMDLLVDAIYAGKLDFDKLGVDQGAGQPFGTIIFEHPEQMLALARFAEQFGSGDDPEVMLRLAQRMRTEAKRHKLNRALAEAWMDCADLRADIPDFSLVDFESAEDAKRFRDRLLQLISQATTDGLPEDAELFRNFLSIIDKVIRFHETVEDLHFFCATLSTMLHPIPDSGLDSIDFTAFQSAEQKETFKSIVLRLDQLLTAPEDEKVLRNAWEYYLDREINEEERHTQRAVVKYLADWAKSEEAAQ